MVIALIRSRQAPGEPRQAPDRQRHTAPLRRCVLERAGECDAMVGRKEVASPRPALGDVVMVKSGDVFR
ncbi:hypothetical protein ACPA9J_34975 [Pseudomonas aeruginosa]